MDLLAGQNSLMALSGYQNKKPRSTAKTLPRSFMIT